MNTDINVDIEYILLHHIISRLNYHPTYTYTMYPFYLWLCPKKRLRTHDSENTVDALFHTLVYFKIRVFKIPMLNIHGCGEDCGSNGKWCAGVRIV